MISVKNVTFSYSKKPFIGPLSFEVKEGEIFGFLGPSGAGKSTLQKILTGTLRGYLGSAAVCGIEVRNANSSFYEKIGVDFEFPSLYEKLTARENLAFFGSLYKGPLKNADALLNESGLIKDADKNAGEFSKGMKSRLNFIKALLHNPDVLFLDEPTSGLDPANAKVMKQMILKEKQAGKSIILTTHNMHDAAELCDRVAFFADGQILALDTPYRLTAAKGASRLSYTYTRAYHRPACDNASKSREASGTFQKEISLDDPAAVEQLSALMAQGRVKTVHSLEPTLEDVFLKITGRALQ